MENKSEPLTFSNEATKKKSIIMIIALVLALILLVSTIVVAVLLSSKSQDYKDLEEKYNNLEEQYDNQNRTVNDIFDSFQGLIANTTMDSNKIDKNNYKNVKSKLNAMINYEDGTYDYINMEKISYKNGYHVSFETKTRYYQYYYTDEEYDNIVYKIASLLGVDADLGVFEHHPQISYWIENKELALSVAALFNQQSIWDWSTNQLIINTMHQPKYF